jgi:hypothetical protein
VFTPAGTPVKQRLDVPASAVAGSAAFQWAAVLKTPPGAYEVRAAVATADGTRAASVFGYVDVPDVEKETLALSGIFVGRGGTPTFQRTFAAGEGIGLSFQVARATNASGIVSVRYEVQDEAGQTIARAEVPHDRALPVAPGVDGYEIGVRAPAPTGRYVMTVEATVGDHAVQRHVGFAVR